MQCAEYRDLVAAHVDAQLTPDEASLAAAHLAVCRRCTGLFEAQRALKEAVRGRRLIHPTPPAARAAVMARIAADEQAQRASWLSTWRPPRLALAALAALLVVGLATILLRPRSPVPSSPLLDTIVAHYHAAASGEAELGVRTDDPMALRAYYLQTGAFTFTNTVVNLEPLGFVLVGGRVSELAGTRSTFSVYRGAQGIVLCHRIPAGTVDLPPGGEVAGGDHFYTVDGITICIHREGDVICFLATAMPRADFVRLIAGHV